MQNAFQVSSDFGKHGLGLHNLRTSHKTSFLCIRDCLVESGDHTAFAKEFLHICGLLRALSICFGLNGIRNTPQQQLFLVIRELDLLQQRLQRLLHPLDHNSVHVSSTSLREGGLDLLRAVSCQSFSHRSLCVLAAALGHQANKTLVCGNELGSWNHGNTTCLKCYLQVRDVVPQRAMIGRCNIHQVAKTLCRSFATGSFGDQVVEPCHAELHLIVVHSRFLCTADCETQLVNVPALTSKVKAVQRSNSVLLVNDFVDNLGGVIQEILRHTFFFRVME
mmetsp:Transcript_40119/g.106427  ORF Transcript_40119/g.106427 Transcript_40119/m.106427 type:complete len:278 (+) Transcript_40119:1971-2804(+)